MFHRQASARKKGKWASPTGDAFFSSTAESLDAFSLQLLCILTREVEATLFARPNFDVRALMGGEQRRKKEREREKERKREWVWGRTWRSARNFEEEASLMGALLQGRTRRFAD